MNTEGPEPSTRPAAVAGRADDEAAQLHQLVEGFQSASLLVLGDVMLDLFLDGAVERISPEAPVPVFVPEDSLTVPGGAANTALNAAALGSAVHLIGARGPDAEGEDLVRLLGKAELRHDIPSIASITTTKTRLRAVGQHVLRIDKEPDQHAADHVAEALCQAGMQALDDLRDGGAVVLSDYSKGAISNTSAETLIRECVGRGVPVVVDSKRLGTLPVAGASLVTPNLREATALLPPGPTRDPVETARAVRDILAVDAAMVTLGDQGIAYASHSEELHVPGHSIQVFDVSGAGDTVAAVAGLALALGASGRQMTVVANIAGSLVVQRLGTAALGLADLLEGLAL